MRNERGAALIALILAFLAVIILFAITVVVIISNNNALEVEPSGDVSQTIDNNLLYEGLEPVEGIMLDGMYSHSETNTIYCFLIDGTVTRGIEEITWEGTYATVDDKVVISFNNKRGWDDATSQDVVTEVEDKVTVEVVDEKTLKLEESIDGQTSIIEVTKFN